MRFFKKSTISSLRPSYPSESGILSHEKPKTALYAFSDNLAVRGIFYFLEHDDFSGTDNNGFDLSIYFGKGFLTNGFKIYGGGGSYRETWEGDTFKESFVGLQLNGGLGYNWDDVSLDLVVGIRRVKDYEDFADQFSSTITVDTAVSASLLLSARF